MGALQSSTLERTPLRGQLGGVLTAAEFSTVGTPVMPGSPAITVDFLTPMVADPLPIGLRFPTDLATHSLSLRKASGSFDPEPGIDKIAAPPAPARKRGKRMSRRGGQNPSVRVGKRADGQKYFFFQYWVDVPGQEERERRTEVIGLLGQLTKSEAERRKLVFLSELAINSNEYRIPSSKTFADAVRHYREKFAPRNLRASTFNVADGHLGKHLEPDWKDTPVEHVTIDAVNEWAYKKRCEGLSWTTIKNILRTMQRVLSCASKDKLPPFSLKGLEIPKEERLQIQVKRRELPSFTWEVAKKLAAVVRQLPRLGEQRRRQYAAVFILAGAVALRCSELFGLRIGDIDFKAGTIQIQRRACQRTFEIGACKNIAAYRTIVLADSQGIEALRILKHYLGDGPFNPNDLVFQSANGTMLRETNVLEDGLHPALEALGLPKAGMHAFRRGCNRRWELAGVNPAVQRQQMGHTAATMTALYTGQIPTEDVRASLSIRNGNKIDVLENMENEVAVLAADKLLYNQASIEPSGRRTMAV